LANRLWTSNQLTEAEKNYRQGLVLKELLVAQWPDNFEYRFHLTHSCLGLGSFLNANKRPREAERLYRQAAALFETLMTEAPSNAIYRNSVADCQNTLAWLLVSDPKVTRADALEAVHLAKKAVELAPNKDAYWNTLGVAHYRAGDWQAVCAALENTGELRQGGHSFDWFFLAMAHWRLGNHHEARRWFDKAIEWMDSNQSKNEELVRFRAEAEELIGPESGAKDEESVEQPD
jgi:tetratricopeptide (TPR) repeat protein